MTGDHGKVGLRRISRVLLAGLVLGLVAGFGGRWHPAGDSLAVFRVPMAALALVLVWPARVGAAGWPVAAALVAILGGWGWARLGPQGPAGEVTVYQKNLLYSNAEVASVAADILVRGPDIVTLQELSRRTMPILDLLAEAYPYRQVCVIDGFLTLAVLTRHPARDGACPAEGRYVALASLTVEIGGRELRASSLHLPWPWPYGQSTKIAPILRELSAWQGPHVVAGDFNMVPWGASVRAIERATGTARVGALRPTLHLWGLRALPIDHVLAPGPGRITVLDRLGSDHRGIWAEVPLQP